jgi:anti-sigma regulatory factor (Ser/Thr protein kinase)
MHFKLKKKQLLDDINEWINAEIQDLTKNTSENIKIVLGEVLQNIIRHGYKNNLNKEDFIDIEFKNNNEELAFIVRDYAEPCNPDSFLNKNFIPNESGHMGISIIRQLTNEFTIKPLQDGNETKLVFKID